jgi:hypothetical protein
MRSDRSECQPVYTQLLGAVPMVSKPPHTGASHGRKITRLLSVTAFSGYDAFQQRPCPNRIAILSYDATT